MKMIAILLTFLALPFSAGAAALTTQTVSETDAALNYQDANQAGNDTVANNEGDTVLVVKNADASDTATMTITPQNATKTIAGLGPMTKAAIVVTVAAASQRIVGPFSRDVWNGASGLVLTYGGTAPEELSVAPIRVPRL